MIFVLINIKIMELGETTLSKMHLLFTANLRSTQFIKIKNEGIYSNKIT